MCAYLWTAGVAGLDGEQFRLVVGDQRSGPGTHARHISFGEPPPRRAPRIKKRDSFLTTARTRSGEVTETSGI